MKNILCFGDSNTHGYIPLDGSRYDSNNRWPSVLQEILGNEYHIIEEGLNGRTINYDVPGFEWKNGMRYIVPCLSTHKPIDTFILMLGSNDATDDYHLSADKIAEDMELMMNTIDEKLMEFQGFLPEMLLISPPHLSKNFKELYYSKDYKNGGDLVLEELPALYKDLSEKHHWNFFNATEAFTVPDIDGLHMDNKMHIDFAKEIAKRINQ